MKYAINVKEILVKTVIVDADNINDAVAKVEEAVERDDIVLDPDADYDESEVTPSGQFENGLVPDGADVSRCFHLYDPKNNNVTGLSGIEKEITDRTPANDGKGVHV